MTRNYHSFDQQARRRALATLHKLQADEQAILTTADWVDQGKKIVRIPIDEAMAKEIDILQGQAARQWAAIPVINTAPRLPALRSLQPPRPMPATGCACAGLDQTPATGRTRRPCANRTT